LIKDLAFIIKKLINYNFNFYNIIIKIKGNKMNLKKNSKKILPLILLSSNILYANVLYIDLNFGSKNNIRTYETGFPTRYSDFSLEDTKRIYSVDKTDIFGNAPKNTYIGGRNYTYDNWGSFLSWGNSIPDYINNNRNYIIMKRHITQVSRTEPRGHYYWWWHIQPSDLEYLAVNPYYNRIKDYNYCRYTRYEANDFYINKLKARSDSHINNNITKFTPELTIRFKPMNNNIGKEFTKDFLNVKLFLNFFSNPQMKTDKIRKDFSNLVTSLDITKW
jgi:hypothetical protein